MTRVEKCTLQSRSLTKYSLLTSLLGIASLELMAKVVSQNWTGNPYSRSSRHTWQTFLSLQHVWKTSVFLYLASRLGLHLKTVNGLGQILLSFSKFAFVCTQKKKSFKLPRRQSEHKRMVLQGVFFNNWPDTHAFFNIGRGYFITQPNHKLHSQEKDL